MRGFGACVFAIALAACGGGAGDPAETDGGAVDGDGASATDGGGDGATAGPIALTVLTWNTGGPLGSAAIDLVAAQQPDIVFLQEVDSVDLVEDLRLRLEQDAGGSWDKAVISRGTDTTSSFVAIVSRFALADVDSLILREPGTYVEPCLDDEPVTFAGRAAVAATIDVGPATVSVFGVRTTSEGDRGCAREQEVQRLKAWAAAEYAAPRVYGGDFNMQPEPGEAEYQLMRAAPLPAADAWAVAVAAGTAIAWDGEPDNGTPTRNTRLDYVFFDQDATELAVTGAEIVDHGDLSDHRLMIATFTVD